MKFELVSDPAGRTGLRATPGAYDAVPLIDTLWVDAVPRAVSSDRLAVAAALAFHSNVSGSFEMQQSMSIATANEIRRFLFPIDCTPWPLSFDPLPLPQGQTTLTIGYERSDSPALPPNENDRMMNLDIRRSDHWAGSLLSMNGMVVGSNAWLMPCRDQHTISYPFLAVAVLLSEDMDADAFDLGYELQDPKELGKLKALIAVCRLGLNRD